MSRAPDAGVRRLLIGIGALWVGFAGWHQILVAEDPHRIRYIMLDQRFEDCRGDFSDRYDCRSAVMLERGQLLFMTWSKRIAVIAGPPLVLALAYGLGRRIRQRREERERELRRRRRRDAASE